MRIDTGLMSGDLAQRREAGAPRRRDAATTASGPRRPDTIRTCRWRSPPRRPSVRSIGTNIAVAFPRSPLVHAQIAWDLQAASRGRFILGLGTQVKGHNERRYSTPWMPPGPRLREMIQLIRHIWDVWQNGTRPGFEGKFYQLQPDDAVLQPGADRVAEDPDLHRRREPVHLPARRRAVRRLPRPPVPLDQVPARGRAPEHRGRGSPSPDARAPDLTLATTAFVITGTDARRDRAATRAPVRQQIAFYASTRTYSGVLEAHGWGETCSALNERAAKGDWTGMAELITDEMLEVYAVQGLVDDLPDLIKKKYTGVLDRLGFYTLPGVLGDEAQRRALVAACRS